MVQVELKLSMAKKRGGRINQRDYKIKSAEDMLLHNPDRHMGAKQALARAKEIESKYKLQAVRIDERTVVLKKIKANK